MNKRRIFLAINLSEQIKKKLLAFQKQWADLPVRWTKESNLHITLVFIGYINDEEMLKICQLTRQVVRNYPPFTIKLEKICLGPPGRPARMIWAEGERNSALAQLKNDLEEALLNSNSSGYVRRENRAFQSHITLARIRQWEWQRLPAKPEIDREISLVFSVDSIEVMQSHLSRIGSDYAVLESVGLGE